MAGQVDARTQRRKNRSEVVERQAKQSTIVSYLNLIQHEALARCTKGFEYSTPEELQEIEVNCKSGLRAWKSQFLEDFENALKGMLGKDPRLLQRFVGKVASLSKDVYQLDHFVSPL
jgi:hypothetical protein